MTTLVNTEMYDPPWGSSVPGRGARNRQTFPVQSVF